MTPQTPQQSAADKIEDTYAVRTLTNAVFGKLVAENWIDAQRFDEDFGGVYDDIKAAVIRALQRMDPADIREFQAIDAGQKRR